MGMYDDWTQAQKLRWFWGGMGLLAFFLFFDLIVFFLINRWLPERNEHISALLGNAAALFLAMYPASILYNHVIAKTIRD